jgi:hypothetical protein
MPRYPTTDKVRQILKSEPIGRITHRDVLNKVLKIIRELEKDNYYLKDRVNQLGLVR